MDLRQLRYFIAIAEEGGFSQAARRLGIAQPALSQHVLSMEAELGVSLLHRTTRGVRPTEAGARLLDEARAIQTRFSIMPDVVRGCASKPAGEVRFGMPGTVSEQLGVPLVNAVRASLPDVHLRISEAMSGFVQDWLHEGRIDVALLFGTADSRDLIRQEALSEEIVLFGRKNAAHADLEGSITLDRALRLPLVVPSPAHGLRTLIDAAALSIGADVNSAVEIDSYRQIKALVAEGTMFGLLPRVAIDTRVFRQWPLASPPLRRRVVLAYSQRRPASSATEAVARMAWSTLHHRVRSGAWPATWTGPEVLGG